MNISDNEPIKYFKSLGQKEPEKLPRMADPVKRTRFRLKAFQILTHLLYHTHSFFDVYHEDYLVVITKPTKFATMMKSAPKDLYRMMEYLKREGYIHDYTHKRGECKVWLLHPENLYNDEIVVDTKDGIDENGQNEVEELAISEDRRWNPQTLSFD